MLKHPYSGWEGELLAAHLLSRICFLARPMSVQTDLGSDFFGTLFEVDGPSSAQPLLRPTCSFGIQVKTAKDTLESIEMTRNLAYLQNLELPFFIGKVILSDARLDIYSAEFLPLLLVHKGIPDELHLEPASQSVDPKIYEHGGSRLLCPFVASLSIGDHRDGVAQAASAVAKVCERALMNLASRRKNQHIYEFDNDTAMILAGPGSWTVFRENFDKSLAEVFANFGRYPDQVSPEEFKAFESLYQQLMTLSSYRLPYAYTMYQLAKNTRAALGLPNTLS